MLALLVGAIGRRVDPLVLLFVAMAGVAGAAAASVVLWDWDGGLAVLRARSPPTGSRWSRVSSCSGWPRWLVLGHHYFRRSGELRTEFYALVLFATSR